MTVIANPPYPSYFDVDGSPLEDGYIYFGAANQNPETNPITVYWDAAYTQPALQPIRTSGGFTYRAGTPANIYVSTDFSITVRDKNRRLVYSKLLSEGQATAEVNLQYSTQSITATSGQTVFGLSTAYTPGNNSLAVYHNGSRLIVGSDYTETSATVITLAIGATAGDVLQFVTATPINPSSLGAAAVAYIPAGAGAVATNVQAKLREIEADEFTREQYATDVFPIETLTEPHAGGLPYTAFFSGAMIGENEIYLARCGQGHTYVAGSPPAKIVYYKRGYNNKFTERGVFYSGFAANQDVRDPYITQSRPSGSGLPISYAIIRASASSAGTTPFSTYIWITDKDFIPIGTAPATTNLASDQFSWGNTLVTPSGRMLFTAYTSGTVAVNLWRADASTLNPVPTFTNVKTLFTNALGSPNETTIGYWGGKLIAIARNGNGNAFALISYTYDLEGLTGWTDPAYLPFFGAAPNLQPYTQSEEPLIVSMTGFTAGRRVNITCQSTLDLIHWTTPGTYAPMDEYGGYATMVKNRNGYGVMYYEDNSPAQTASKVWFKDLDVPRSSNAIESLKAEFAEQTLFATNRRANLINSQIVYGNPIAITALIASGGGWGAEVVFRKSTTIKKVVSMLAAAAPVTGQVAIYLNGSIVATSSGITITNTAPEYKEFDIAYTFLSGVTYKVAFLGTVRTYGDSFPTGTVYRNTAIDYGLFKHIRTLNNVDTTLNTAISIGFVPNV